MSSQFDQIDDLIAQATADPHHNVPRVVVMAADSNQLLYTGCGGVTELPASEYPEALRMVEKVTEKHIFGLASATKLVTAIATLQLVESGRLALGDDARQYLQEMKDAKLFKEYDDEGNIVLVKNNVPITIEMLLCHTSGFVFSEAGPEADRVRQELGLSSIFTPTSTRDDVTKMPLMFTPGSSWAYGTSLEWLGFVLEKVSQMSLGDYFQENIFTPLGISPSEMSFTPPPHKLKCAVPPEAPTTCYVDGLGQVLSQTYRMGGAGLNGTPAAYMKILRSLLSGTDPILLKSGTIDLLFQPRLSQGDMIDAVTFGTKSSSPFTMFKEKAHKGVNWAMGGGLSGDAYESGRGSNSLFWAGFPGTHWFVDREKDLAFLIWTQVIPLGDPNLYKLWEKVETELYRVLAR